MAARTLQDLEILNVGIFTVGVELDSGHGHVHVDAVEYLAEGGTADVLGQLDHGRLARHIAGEGSWNSPSSALLNLGDVELQEAVQPLHELLSVCWTRLGPIPACVCVLSLYQPRLAHFDVFVYRFEGIRIKCREQQNRRRSTGTSVRRDG